MKTGRTIGHQFVEFIPEVLDEHNLYISIKYNTAVHKCCCGCGREVVTPISPTDWQLIYDGKTISLSPSIGSWSLPCQSHYFITQSRVEWAPKWTPHQIAGGRAQEAKAKVAYFAAQEPAKQNTPVPPAMRVSPKENGGLWTAIKGWFSRRP